MRLRKVRLQNYRNHADTELSLEGVTFAIVRGPNAAGKSSLGQAISVNLCDTTMGLGADGAGFRSKIKDNEKQAIITTEIQGQHILEKKVTLNLSATGRTATVKCLDSPEDTKTVKGFENFLTRYQDALKIALNTDAFTKLGDKEQKALLAKLVLPSRYDFPKDQIEAVNSLIDTAIDFNQEPFAVIELAYKKLYKERENINRDVKNFVIPEALPIPKGVDSESLQKDLAKVKAERVKVQGERDAAVARANEVEVKRATLKTKVEHLRAERDKGLARIKELESKILSDEGLASLQKVAARSAELEKLNIEHRSALASLQTYNKETNRLKDIKDTGATCPTCNQTIDSDKFSALIAEIDKEYARADAVLQELDKKIEAIGDCAAASTSIREHQQAVEQKEQIEASLKEISKTGKASVVELNGLGEKVDATLPFHNPLEVLQTQEDNILTQLRPVITAEERAENIKKKKEQFEKLEKKAETLQELVTYFDKDGIKAKLIAQHIGSFENKIQTVLRRFGYKAMLGADMEFKVETKRGYTGPIIELSKAERQMFYPAFQCAVSVASGIKMAVIDDMDTYLKETGMRSEMYMGLYELIKDGSLEQIIIIEASTDKTVPTEGRAPGSAYYWVDDGMVERLE